MLNSESFEQAPIIRATLLLLTVVSFFYRGIGAVERRSMVVFKLFVMAKNVLLAAIGGAAAGVALANYLSSERGKELLHSASGTFNDLKEKATGYVKNSLPNKQQHTEMVQPS